MATKPPTSYAKQWTDPGWVFVRICQNMSWDVRFSLTCKAQMYSDAAIRVSGKTVSPNILGSMIHSKSIALLPLPPPKKTMIHSIPHLLPVKPTCENYILTFRQVIPKRMEQIMVDMSTISGGSYFSLFFGLFPQDFSMFAPSSEFHLVTYISWGVAKTI